MNSGTNDQVACFPEVFFSVHGIKCSNPLPIAGVSSRDVKIPEVAALYLFYYIYIFFKDLH